MEITETKESEQGQEKQEEKRGYEPLESVKDADLSSGKPDKIIETATSDRIPLLDNPPEKVEVTAQDKTDFLNAVVTGERYTSRVSLFNGRVNVKFRARSLSETEAIMAYMQHEGLSGTFTTQASVQDAALLALLVAQVAELNGVEYTEMKAPLLYQDSLNGQKPPAWAADLEVWRAKPEALVSALGDALVQFEAKYWTMVKASGDENFWNPDGSTGK